MPHSGGYNPAPRRNGGTAPELQRHVEGLAAELGIGAYDTTTPQAPVNIELQALARVINAAWEQNRRMALQWDPLRMTDFLPRWEAILGITPLLTDTPPQRRQRVAVAMSRVGYARQQDVTDALTALLGANFVGIVNQSSATANVWTPLGWPMGSHAVDPVTGLQGTPDWYSSIAMVMVQVVKITNQTEAQFYAAAGSIIPTLDSIMPAWVTFDWFRQSVANGAGFWLDDSSSPNLDNQTFDS